MTLLADRIDHIVLTVADIEATTRFYERALELKRETFRGPDGQRRHALTFGRQKINLQDSKHGDADESVAADARVRRLLLARRRPARRGRRAPARGGHRDRGRARAAPRRHGRLRSIYFRDPDGNLVEVAEYVLPLRPISDACTTGGSAVIGALGSLTTRWPIMPASA